MKILNGTIELIKIKWQLPRKPFADFYTSCLGVGWGERSCGQLQNENIKWNHRVNKDKVAAPPKTFRWFLHMVHKTIIYRVSVLGGERDRAVNYKMKILNGTIELIKIVAAPPKTFRWFLHMDHKTIIYRVSVLGGERDRAVNYKIKILNGTKELIKIVAAPPKTVRWFLHMGHKTIIYRVSVLGGERDRDKRLGDKSGMWLDPIHYICCQKKSAPWPF